VKSILKNYFSIAKRKKIVKLMSKKMILRIKALAFARKSVSVLPQASSARNGSILSTPKPANKLMLKEKQNSNTEKESNSRKSKGFMKRKV
jgi:hypothetical protein